MIEEQINESKSFVLDCLLKESEIKPNLKNNDNWQTAKQLMLVTDGIYFDDSFFAEQNKVLKWENQTALVDVNKLKYQKAVATTTDNLIFSNADLLLVITHNLFVDFSLDINQIDNALVLQDGVQLLNEQKLEFKKRGDYFDYKTPYIFASHNLNVKHIAKIILQGSTKTQDELDLISQLIQVFKFAKQQKLKTCAVMISDKISQSFDANCLLQTLIKQAKQSKIKLKYAINA